MLRYSYNILLVPGSSKSSNTNLYPPQRPLKVPRPPSKRSIPGTQLSPPQQRSSKAPSKCPKHQANRAENMGVDQKSCCCRGAWSCLFIWINTSTTAQRTHGTSCSYYRTPLCQPLTADKKKVLWAQRFAYADGPSMCCLSELRSAFTSRKDGLSIGNGSYARSMFISMHSTISGHRLCRNWR